MRKITGNHGLEDPLSWLTEDVSMWTGSEIKVNKKYSNIVTPPEVFPSRKNIST